jgi:PAS domain S-box-containing protein
MPRGLETAGVWVAITVMVMVASIGYRTTDGLVETSRWVEHTHQAIQAFDDVLLGATAAGRSRRAYWMTGDDAEWPRVATAMERAESALAQARTLTADNTRQSERLDRLGKLVEARFVDLNAALDAQRAAPTVRDESREEAMSRRGNTSMSEIASDIEDATHEERALLAQRQQDARRSATFAKGAGLGGTAISVALLVFAFARLRRENARRMESERALRASEQRLATTLYSIRDGVIATDASGRIEHINRAAEHLTATRPADAVGKPLTEVFRCVDEHTRGAKPDPLLSGGQDDNGTLIARDGTERFVASSTAPIVDPKGGRLSGIVLVFRDTTQERSDRRALESATHFLDSIVEHIPDMIFVKEAGELRFQRINRAGEVLLGMQRDQLLGKNDYDFFPKEQADFFQTKDRETLSQAVAVDIPEEPIETKTGRRWLHTKKVPLLDDKGNAQFLLGISEDITERKETAEALRAAIIAAESANRELEAFSYSVAHDLRAPLRSIDGFSQAILEDCAGQLDDIGQKHLQRVRASASRMAELIDGLLGLSRLTRTELRLEPVDLSALATAAAEELRNQSPERDVRVEIAPSLGAHGDPRVLRIVVDNLFGNAFKFTATHRHAKIEFGVRAESGSRVFFVRDDGVGFDSRYKDKLFGAFQRLHDAREFPGTGIGLATVQRAVKRHGGRVWAESEPGRGATFFFTLDDGAAAQIAG